MLDCVTKNYGPSRVDVHEHRAPTDDSARLLREMEEKASERVLAVLRVGTDNEFKGTAVRMIADPLKLRQDVMFMFSLNGHEHMVRVESQDSIFLEPQEVMRRLRDEVAKAIANEIVVKSAGEWSRR